MHRNRPPSRARAPGTRRIGRRPPPSRTRSGEPVAAANGFGFVVVSNRGPFTSRRARGQCRAPSCRRGLAPSLSGALAEDPVRAGGRALWVASGAERGRPPPRHGRCRRHGAGLAGAAHGSGHPRVGRAAYDVISNGTMWFLNTAVRPRAGATLDRLWYEAWEATASSTRPSQTIAEEAAAGDASS